MKNLQAPWFEKAEFYSDLDFRRLGNSSFQWGPSDKVNRKKKKKPGGTENKTFYYRTSNCDLRSQTL